MTGNYHIPYKLLLGTYGKSKSVKSRNADWPTNDRMFNNKKKGEGKYAKVYMMCYFCGQVE